MVKVEDPMVAAISEGKRSMVWMEFSWLLARCRRMSTRALESVWTEEGKWEEER